jgi:hypothetical protein
MTTSTNNPAPGMAGAADSEAVVSNNTDSGQARHEIRSGEGEALNTGTVAPTFTTGYKRDLAVARRLIVERQVLQGRSQGNA